MKAAAALQFLRISDAFRVGDGLRGDDAADVSVALQRVKASGVRFERAMKWSPSLVHDVRVIEALRGCCALRRFESHREDADRILSDHEAASRLKIANRGRLPDVETLRKWLAEIETVAPGSNFMGYSDPRCASKSATSSG